MYYFSTALAEFINSPTSFKYSKDFNEILENIKVGFQYEHFNTKIQELTIDSVEEIKEEALKWMINYAQFILSDGVITEIELNDFTFLKKIFRIKEGDFMKCQPFNVLEILKMEFVRIYSDRFVDKKEKLLKINLQSLFGLSYDEFEAIKKDQVVHSLMLGADPSDLDIAIIPKWFKI